jgi:hypothetical protein
MVIRERTSRSSVLLCSLALLLAMHPLSGSAGGRGEGLAALIRSLLCGCEVCSSRTAPESAPSCCHRDPAPDEREPDEREAVKSCPCSHPGDLPLPAPTPLSEGPGANAGDAAASLVTHFASLSAATPVPFADAALAWSGGEPPGARPCLRPPRVRPGVAEALGVSGGPRKRLAVLQVARI